MARPISILIVNPNSSEGMTSMMKKTIDSLGFPNTEYVYFTCPPSGPKSIDSSEDATRSAEVCLPLLKPLISQHDGILVACYSQHPLVAQLGAFSSTYVMGIFEASITAALNLLVPNSGLKFGVVTTGKAWEEPLSYGVRSFLAGGKESEGDPPRLEKRFVGVESTGLSARELHDVDEKEVKDRIRRSTSRLLSKAGAGEGKEDVGVVCLGCAGMTGFDDAVRLGCMDYYGEEGMRKVKVVDAVKAGVVMLQGLIRGKF